MLLPTMASTSDGDEDKKNDLDANDVRLSIDEGHFVHPTPTNTSAPPPSHPSPPKSPKVGKTPSEQGRKLPDPPPPAAADRRQAFKKLGSTVSYGEDPLTEERHSKQSTEVQSMFCVIASLS